MSLPKVTLQVRGLARPWVCQTTAMTIPYRYYGESLDSKNFSLGANRSGEWTVPLWSVT